MKFALGTDEQPVLDGGAAGRTLDRDALGIAIARLLAVCDLLLDESVRWLWPGRSAARARDGATCAACSIATATELASSPDASAPATTT